MVITKTREKILRLFFDRPELRIHQRGVVRRAGVSPQNAHLYLQEFVEKGWLLRGDFPHFVLYRINPASAPIFKLFEMFELERREEFISRGGTLANRLLTYMRVLSRLSEREIRSVILFGPAARGEWEERSQVDIAAIAADGTNPQKIERMHRQAAQKVGRMLRISWTHFAIQDFIGGFRKKAPFFDELWKDRIVLHNEYLFWQMVRIAKTRIKNLIL